MDPNNFFEITVRVRDKKTGITIDLSIEGLMRLIRDVKNIFKVDSEVDRVGDMFTSGCTIIKTDGVVYRIEQTYGLASRRFILIHETSLRQLICLENIFLQKTVTYEALAPIYIELLRKYVAATRTLIDGGNEKVKKNKLSVLAEALVCTRIISDETEKNFICDTYANFQCFFLSFFD